MSKVCTYIKATPKDLSILNSVLGQMSDGIWENTRSMERYWKSLDVTVGSDGYLYIEDKFCVCGDPVDFMANKIKQVLKIEQDEGHRAINWDRSCVEVSHYINHQPVTVGECYRLYDALKGRDTTKKTYATRSPYEVKIDFNGSLLTLIVEAANKYDAIVRAKNELFERARVTAVPV